MKCSKCGKTFSDNEKWCSFCGTLLSGESTKTRYGSGGGDSIFEAPLRNVMSILTTPAKFITTTGKRVSSVNAWLFALIVSAIGVTFQFIWSHEFNIFSAITDTFSSSSEVGFSNSKLLIFSPIVTTLHLLLFTLYAHFMLTITASKKGNFWKTFNVICFTESASLLQIIPFGSVIIPFWAPVILISMLSAQHRISKLRTILVILAPFIVLFILAVVIIVSIFGGGLFLINYLKIFGL